MLKKILLTVFTILYVSSFSWAETIYLLSGEVIKGNVVVRESDYIQVDTAAGIPVTYYLDEIDRIDGDSQNVSEQITDSSELPVIEQEILQDVPIEESFLKEDLSIENDISSDNFSEHDTQTITTDQDKVDFNSKNQYSVGKKHEDFIISRIQRESDALKDSEDADDNRSYLDKQRERHMVRQKERLEDVMISLESKMPHVFDRATAAVGTDVETIKNILVAGSQALVAAFIIAWILFCFPLMILAKKFRIGRWWMAWIPILNLFLFLKLACEPWWLVVALLVPGLNFLVQVVLWSKIAKYTEKPIWLGALTIIPGLNFIIPLYIAISF